MSLPILVYKYKGCLPVFGACVIRKILVLGCKLSAVDMEFDPNPAGVIPPPPCFSKKWILQNVGMELFFGSAAISAGPVVKRHSRHPEFLPRCHTVSPCPFPRAGPELTRATETQRFSRLNVGGKVGIEPRWIVAHGEPVFVQPFPVSDGTSQAGLQPPPH